MACSIVTWKIVVIKYSVYAVSAIDKWHALMLHKKLLLSNIQFML